MVGTKKRRVARMVVVPDDEPTDYIRIIKRRPVAKMFGVTVVRIDQLTSMGIFAEGAVSGTLACDRFCRSGGQGTVVEEADEIGGVNGCLPEVSKSGS